jgi:3-oxoacyl-[acyl-carrier protein] reductase
VSQTGAFDLRGRVAVVTGGSRGIGAAVVRLLAACGADVCIGYRARSAEAERVREEVAALGVRAIAVAADLGDPAGAEALLGEAERVLGAVHIVVHSAGVWPVEDVPVAAMDLSRWQRTMRENVDAMFFVSRAAARALGPGGRLVHVSSTAGQRGEAGHADYAASKGAMISFVKSLAVELAPRDIAVNCVAPGWVDTEMAAPALQGDARVRIAATIPVGRIATAEDVAHAIVALCMPGARHVVGEVLNVNGGSVLAG